MACPYESVLIGYAELYGSNCSSQLNKPLRGLKSHSMNRNHECKSFLAKICCLLAELRKRDYYAWHFTQYCSFFWRTFNTSAIPRPIWNCAKSLGIKEVSSIAPWSKDLCTFICLKGGCKQNFGGQKPNWKVTVIIFSKQKALRWNRSF